MITHQCLLIEFRQCFTVQPNGCWLWDRAKITSGYGTIVLDGKQIYAHRLSWILHRGPIPDGAFVCHNCPGGDNPSCVNPDHLWIGTAKLNSRDALKKGRLTKQAKTFRELWLGRWKSRRGEGNARHKLSTEQVLEMRRLHDEEGWGYERLRKHFNVSFGVAQRIINRQSWASV